MSRKNKTHDSGQRNKSELRETAVKYQASSQPDTEAPIDDHGDQGWIDFREQCRRQMQRPMALRIKYGFCRIYRPVLDDAPWRAFDTMEEYRTWCEENLPEYLGFRRAK
jgi:hypothetical protein